MNEILEAIKNNPVVVKSLVTLIVAAAAVFGFDVSADQLFGVLIALGLVTTPIVRAKVTPVRKG